jgi:tetratricopeptide (TPR) repeat protein
MPTVPVPTARPGRNDPCPCGSGKKYKACCAEAEARFQVRKTPDAAEWLARARQSVAAGRFGDAEFWFREVLAARPNDAEALAGVGQALCWRRRRREGREYLRQAAKQVERQGLKNRDTGALLQLSGQLQHWGEMDAALRLARLGVRLAPESAVAQNNLALCLARVHRVGEALPPARQAAERLPGHPGCQILVALLDQAEGRLAEARARLEQVTATGSDPEQTARAWLELGAVLDKQQEYDAAFAAFRRAAELHAGLPAARAMDHGRVFDSLARHKAGFDEALLNRWTAKDFADGLPVPGFLFGFLRSGTTLAEQVLDAHPEVVASDENDFIFELAQELARRTGIPDDIPAALKRIGLDEARRLRKFYWQRVAEEYGDEALRKRFVDKLALNSIDAGLIATLFPEAKILFALRDPRDVALSCFQQAFGLSPATVNLLSFEGIARQYAAVMDFWLHIRARIAPEFLELRYEDAVGNFEATFRRVFGLLGVEWRPEVLAFHERARGRYISTPSFAAVSRPLYQSAVARWRRYARHCEPVLPILQPYIEAFGYESR